MKLISEMQRHDLAVPPSGHDAPKRFKDDPKIVDTQFERIDDVIMGGVGLGGDGMEMSHLLHS